MFSQASLILFTISLMATRSLLVLVTVRSVCILLECFLVGKNECDYPQVLKIKEKITECT